MQRRRIAPLTGARFMHAIDIAVLIVDGADTHQPLWAAEMQLSGGDAFRPRSQGAPYRQSGLLGTGDLGKQLRPRLGIDAVGGDDEIVIAGAAVGELDARPLLSLLDRSGGDAALNLNARGDRCLGQDAVEVGAGNANLCRPLGLSQRWPRGYRDHFAAGCADREHIGGHAGRDTGLRRTDGGERFAGIAHDGKADAAFIAEFIFDLDQVDIDTAARKSRAGGKARNPAADDQRFLNAHVAVATAGLARSFLIMFSRIRRVRQAGLSALTLTSMRWSGGRLSNSS